MPRSEDQFNPNADSNTIFCDNGHALDRAEATLEEMARTLSEMQEIIKQATGNSSSDENRKIVSKICSDGWTARYNFDPRNAKFSSHNLSMTSVGRNNDSVEKTENSLLIGNSSLEEAE